MMRTLGPCLAACALLLGCSGSVPPIIVGLDDRSVQVGSLLEQVVRGTVPGSILLEAPHPVGAMLVPLAAETATAMLRWIPLASDVGTVPLTFALEGGGARATETMIVTVLTSDLGRPQFQGTPYNLLLDLSQAEAVTQEIVLKDDDDTENFIEIAPGAELENASLELGIAGKRATFTFRPSASQLAARCSFGTQLRASDKDGHEARAGVFIEARNGCGAEPGVLINEILFDPPTTDDVNKDGRTGQLLEEEFVELVNISDRPIELGGATLSDSTMVRFTFPTPTTLMPRQAAVVFGGGTPMGFPADVRVYSVSPGGFGNQGLSLNNGGDTVLLRSSDGAIIDSVTYPAACVACSDGIDQSVTREAELNRNTRFVAHDKVPAAQGAKYSPGRRASGAAF